MCIGDKGLLKRYTIRSFGAMNVEIQINNTANPAARFVTWSPAICRIRLTNTAGAAPPAVDVTISGQSAPGGGALIFRPGVTGGFSSRITLRLPFSGVSVPFFMAGQFGRPSVAFGDVTVVATVGTAIVGSAPVMVRVRKDANTLLPFERNRLLSALARLNNQGIGRFADFRETRDASTRIGTASTSKRPTSDPTASTHRFSAGSWTTFSSPSRWAPRS